MMLAYDAEADVLYVTFEEDAGPCSYVENAVGDILRIDTRNQRVVACTVPFFSARCEADGSVQVPEVGTVPVNEPARQLLQIRKAG